MDSRPLLSPAWRWPKVRLRWALWAGVFFLLNAIWRAGVVTLDLRASGFSTSWLQPMVWELTSGAVVWTLLPLVQTVALNAPWRGVSWSRFLGLHLLGTLVFWMLHVAGLWGARILVYRAAGWGAYDYGTALYRVIMEGGKDIVAFAMLALFFHLVAIRHQRQAREMAAARLETELREARLQALSAQLDPHFLFNALNTLSAVMYEDLAKADHLITALGQMLRDGLQAGGPTWTLERELMHLQHYLAIAEARFGDRLKVDQAIAAELQSIPVPRFALQRLVENALKHNEGTPGRVLHVRIEAGREGGSVRLAVSDDGMGFLDGSSSGVGLDNLRRSLALLHGEEGRLEVDSASGGGAKVCIHLPMEARHG
jgi:signal transduction histidine kinase